MTIRAPERTTLVRVIGANLGFHDNCWVRAKLDEGGICIGDNVPHDDDD